MSTLCFHYQQCDPLKALQYAGKAMDVLLEQVKTVFDFVDCMEVLLGSIACCSTSAHANFLEDLVRQTQIAIVVFCMNEGVLKDLKSKRKKLTSSLRRFELCMPCISAVVPMDSTEFDSFDHEEGSVRFKSSIQDKPEPQRKSSDPTTAEGGSLRSSSKSNKSAKFQAYAAAENENERFLSETDRTKKMFLIQLSQMVEKLGQFKNRTTLF